MSGRGGYQPPKNPAPVSAPGAMSRRTDGGPGAPLKQRMQDLPNPDYGEQQTFRADQAGAPMDKAAGPPAPPQVAAADLSQVVPFGAPSQNPSQPVTHGAASGPGGGPEVLGLSGDGNDPAVQRMRQNLPMYELLANMPQSSPDIRNFVRRLKAVV